MIKSMKIHQKHLRVESPKRTFQPLHVAASAGTAAGASASGEGDGSAPARNGWGSIARSAWTVMADHREERHQKKDDFCEL